MTSDESVPVREPATDALLGALASTRSETAHLVRALQTHHRQTEQLLKEINRHELDTARLLQGITDSLDALDRLLASDEADAQTYRASVRRTAEVLVNALCDNSALDLIGQPGEIADPETHTVIDVRDAADFAPDTVLHVLERGIRYRGELVRPASVIVSSGKENHA